MHSLFDIRNHYIRSLSERCLRNEASVLFSIAAEDTLNCGSSRINLLLHEPVNIEHRDRLLHILEELKGSRPIQHILGKAPFYGMDFKVDRSTLIPRPETEELVDLIIKTHRGDGVIHLLDIGTGSGCIAITLAKYLTESRVEAIDYSAEALAIARQNALDLQVTVSFQQMDILQWPYLLDPKVRYDVIVSNPPYITPQEKQEMSSNVLDHEPHSALFVEEDAPLLFYDTISSLAASHLSPHGHLYFEINQYLSEETARLIQSKGFNQVEILHDLNKAPRMIHVTSKK